MNFDIQTFSATALASLKEFLGEDWNKVKDTAIQFFEEKQERLQELADLRLQGEIDDNFLLDRVKDEGDIFVSEAAALETMGAANAEKILQTIGNILLNTLLTLL